MTKNDDSNQLAQKLFKLILEEAMPIESHLPESYFTERLKVSRTPVRKAMQRLEAIGLIERRPNKGYFLITHPQEDDPFNRKNQLPEDVIGIPPFCFTIGTDYLTGVLNQRFTEAELAKHYQVSRSTAQQAISSMESEGWIHRLLGYGWEFNEFLTSQDTYDQCFRYRLLIEPTALLEPSYCVDKVAFSELRKIQTEIVDGRYKNASEATQYAIGTHFHETLVAFSNNNFLLEGIKRANRLRRLIELNVYKRRKTYDIECREHLKLLDLIESGDLYTAADFLRCHLERARGDKLQIAKQLIK